MRCCHPLLSDVVAQGPASISTQVIKGGAEGTRTPDPHTASVVRYQLRHSPLPTRSGVSEPVATVQARPLGPAQGW